MLIAPVVNNLGKRGCGVLWRHKYYGKCAARPRRRREGTREQEAQKGETLEGGDGKQREGKGDDVRVKDGTRARMMDVIKGGRGGGGVEMGWSGNTGREDGGGGEPRRG